MTRFYLFSPIIILLAFTLLTATSCTNAQDREADKVLNAADAVMFSRPDSALQILTDLDTTSLSDSRIARYALLMTKASDKNYLPLTNDSLILKAVNHYSGRGDSLETQALYYYGSSMFELNKIEEALAYLNLAYDHSKNQKDYFYEALSARSLSDIYKNIGVFEKQKEYALKAKQAFTNKEKYSNDTSLLKASTWMNIMIELAEINLNNPENAIELCSKPDSLWFKNDEYYRHRTLINKAYAYHLLKKYNEASSIYEYLLKDGYKFRAYDWCCLAHNYYNCGRVPLANAALDSARVNINDNVDSLYYLSIKSWKYYFDKNYQSAFDTNTILQKELSMKSKQLIESNNTTTLINSYKELSNQNIRKAKNLKFRLIFFICSSAILITLLILLSIKYRNNKSNLNELNLRIESLLNECNELNCIISENSLNYELLNNSIKEYVNKVIKSLDEICTLWFNTPASDKDITKLSRGMEKIFNKLSSNSSEDKLQLILDLYCKDILDEAVYLKIDLSPNNIILIKYLYVGFSLETIAVLMKKETTNAIRIDKTRLKKIIMSSTNDEKEKFLHKIGIN